MQCPRCTQWSVVLQYGMRACVAPWCGWQWPAEWKQDKDRVAIEHAERRDN